ncbi:helix-turn-helix domain-containing protein [Enterobacter sp. C4G1]|uniref:helix-turn-helix domain-containing protein n=1 Tax=Enterobacter sp. C4G1 TaxID=3458724 RepID=UPI004067E45C
MSSAEKTRRSSPFARELITHLQPYSTVRHFSRGEQLDLQVNGKAMCYLILEGTVAVYRRSDHLLLSTAKPPAVFGVANISAIFFDDYLKVVEPSQIGVISAAQVNAVIEEKALWSLLSSHLMYMYNRLYNTIMPQGALTSYELICQQLVQLMNEDESYRRGITAERYIRDKTQLSRSGVMRILADLKAGGYVEMEEGRLLKINKLPAKY